MSYILKDDSSVPSSHDNHYIQSLLHSLIHKYWGSHLISIVCIVEDHSVGWLVCDGSLASCGHIHSCCGHVRIGWMDKTLFWNGTYRNHYLIYIDGLEALSINFSYEHRHRTVHINITRVLRANKNRI